MLFFTVLLSQENLKVVYEGHKILKENVEYQKKNFLRGNTPKFEYLRVLVQYENDKVQVQGARKKYINSINNLYTLIGVKLISKLEDVNHNIVGDLLTKITDFDISNISLFRAKNMGLSNRIDIRELYIQKRMLELKKEITGAGWKPTISIFGKISYDYAQDRELSPLGGITIGPYKGIFNWMVGVQMQITISDAIPGSVGYNMRTSLGYDIKALRYNIKSLKDRVKQEITQNYLTLKEAEKNIEKRKSVMKMAKENFKIARRLFYTGGMDYLNYRDVDLQARQAKIGYYRELYAYNVAYLNFANSIGKYKY